MRKTLLVYLLANLVAVTVLAQDLPGDWFREYAWNVPEIKGNETFLRVGGKFDYQAQPPRFPEGHYKDGQVLIPGKVSLENATRAEIMVEKMLCHDYTTGLAIQLNDHEFIEFPEAEGIPEPEEGYMHHFFPTVHIPLEQLTAGENNFFSLRVDSFQHWGWPQNIVYGLVLRVYYDVEGKSAPCLSLGQNTNKLSVHQPVGLKGHEGMDIARVDYLAHYYGPNMEGDGIYTRWRYGWFRGELVNHLGTAREAPFQVVWNTAWVPDQEEPIKLAARLTFADGLMHFTMPLEKLELQRDYSVEFCEPYNVPTCWVTRNDEYSSTFYMHGDPEKVEKLKMVWRSWSPGYMNGLYLNDLLVFVREGQRYAYHEHEIVLEDKEILSILNLGTNYVKTGKTPEYNWQMVHGMEVQYPGPMVLIKYKK